MAKVTGGGILGNKNVSVGQRTGTGSRGSSPAAASALGQSTAFRKEQIGSERGYSGGGKFGNEIALNAAGAKAGPGAGRTLYGQGGTQGTHGPVAGTPRPESRDFFSGFGPERKT
jgi:hypothetical protein